MPRAHPTVSVCIVTYQHARFIAQAIEGALMQKTDFPFEILIGEDGSTDGTREICQKFAAAHPDRIRLFLRRREDVIMIGGRATGRFNFLSTLRAAQGRYIAICDGDDFWTDSQKLARQVALLEGDPAVAIAFHEVLQLHPDGRTEKTCLFPDGSRFEQDDLLLENFIPNVSVCFRRPLDWGLLNHLGDAPVGDWILHALIARDGLMAFDARPMAVYRLHPGGFWQQLPESDRNRTTEEIRTRVTAVLKRPRGGLRELWLRDQRRLDWLRQHSRKLEEELAGYRQLCESLQRWNSELKQSQTWHADQVSAGSGRVTELERHARQQGEALRGFQENLDQQRQELERHQAELARKSARIAELDRALDLEFIHRREESARADRLARELQEYRTDHAELEAQAWFQEAAAAAAGRAWEEAMHVAMSSDCTYYIEQIFDEPTQQGRTYRGWAFAADGSPPEMRARSLGRKRQEFRRAKPQARPDVSGAHPNASEAGQSGFEVAVPLPSGEALVLLELKTQSGWIAFHRETIAVVESPLTERPASPASSPATVTVIIPCFNYGQFVMEAVESALAQTWPFVDVLVVDDGSTDAATVATLDRIRHSRVRVLRTPNRGLPAARNHGIRATTSEFICCLDADDKLDPTYVEKCLFLMSATGADIGGTWQRNFGLDDALHQPGDFTMHNLWWENRMINSAVYPRKLWEICGGYDETLTVGYEDWEFWMRCARLGARAAVVPEALFFYRKHGHSMLDRVRARHDEVAGEIRRRHYAGGPQALVRSPIEAAQIEMALDRLLAPHPGTREARPRVILALPWLVLGGVDTLLSQICRHLASCGIRLIVVTTEPTSPAQGDTIALFAKITPEIFRLPQFLPHSHWPAFLRHLVGSRRATHLWLAGSAFVYHELSALHDEYPRLKVFDLLFNTEGHTKNNRRHAHHLDLTLCENTSIREWLLAHGESAERIRLVSNGVDLGRFQPAGRPGARRTLPDARPDAFLVGFLGRFSHEKAPDAFVHLAAAFSADPGVQFVLAGSGSIEPGLRELAVELGADNLLWPGVVDAAGVLPAFDVLVLPSRIDGRPNAVLEAMACGVPVIATRVGGLPELIEDGVTGFLVDGLDLAALTAAIRRLREDPALRAKMGRAARARAERDLDLHRTFEIYEALFEGRSP